MKINFLYSLYVFYFVKPSVVLVFSLIGCVFSQCNNRAPQWPSAKINFFTGKEGVNVLFQSLYLGS